MSPKFNLQTYLAAGTPESLMRLLSFICVITGCIFIFSIIFYLIFSLIQGMQINLVGIAACVSAGATLIGTGIAGKAYQKRFEQYTTYTEDGGYESNDGVPLNKKTNLPPGIGEADTEGV